MPHASLTPHHFEVLSNSHNIQFFHCEEPDLNNYLHTQALWKTNHNLARTFVCIDEIVPFSDSVIGYFTLRAGGWQSSPTDFIPAVEIAYLAHHQARKGDDWGNVLLSEACAKVVEVGERIGVRGVYLFPISQKSRIFYAAFGFRPLPSQLNVMFMLLSDIPPL